MKIYRIDARWRRGWKAATMTLVAVAALLAGARGARADKKINVVTTTEDLASITSEIGGDLVSVESLSRGYQDPHFVDAKPSYLVKLRKADLFVEVGRDLEVGWVPGLLNSARNAKILPGGAGFVDASKNIQVLELGGPVGREQGDVHPLGNPHYWLDPENGLIMAAAIRDGLARVSPAGAATFASRYADFERRLRAKESDWKERAKAIGLTGSRVVTYHRSWPYFARAFGLQVLDFVEPKPGVPPTPRHVQDLTAEMKAQSVKLLIVEPYFDPKLPQEIARTTGASLVILPPSVGASKEVTSYLGLFDAQLALIEKALSGKGS